VKSSQRSLLLGLLLAFFVVQGAMHNFIVYKKWSKDYAMQNVTGAVGLQPDQMLLALAGFRELIAGILWVRADSFFDNGNYDAILPMIRLVTILDPHQIDVYGTGMWHIAYNFTDEEQRSDRRYIPSALALAKEGAMQNPDTYEMFFETGWLWYHKIEDDYPQAVKWFKQAMEKDDIPTARRNLYRNVLERDGRPDEALDYLLDLSKDAEERMEFQPSGAARINLETINNNADNLLVRMVQRGYLAKKEGKFEQGNYDTNPPFDVGFSAKVSVIEPMVLRVEGTWNVLPVGTRVRFILRDANLANTIAGAREWDNLATEVNLDPPKDVTYLQEQLFVRNRRFNKRIDMSKDPTMYPLTTDEYLAEFFYNPRQAPNHIQDKFGWSGEGMTDKNFLREDLRDGQRVVYTAIKLTRDQIMRKGEWRDTVPSIRTDNFVDKQTETTIDDIIVVPSLRSGEGQ
jgi:hypothetical protein